MNYKKKMSIGMFVVVLAFGAVLIGCNSAPEPATHMSSRVPWSDYSVIPSKDYTVVGTVIVRDANPNTLSTDLMEKAVTMGAHDIINIRVDIERKGEGRGIIVISASAVAIKYTDETLKSKTTTTTVTDQGSVTEMDETIITKTEDSSNQQQHQGLFGR